MNLCDSHTSRFLARLKLNPLNIAILSIPSIDFKRFCGSYSSKRFNKSRDATLSVLTSSGNKIFI